MDPARLLLGGGLLLGALALSGLIFRWLHISAIPAFILLGLALHPLLAESAIVDVFADLGVVLLLFFVGLEFSLGALLAGRRRLLGHGLRDLGVCYPVGFAAGLLLGWGPLGAALLGGAFYVSSSAIIARGLIELRRTANPEAEAALGILVFEDLAVALLLALLSGVVFAGGDLLGGLAGAGRAAAFFGVALVVAVAGRPILDRLLGTEDDDLFLLAVAAALLLLAWVAVVSGLSEAIGAFLAGTLLAETRHKPRIEALFAPLQGLFAALFFLSFGLSIDVREFAGVWLPALALALLGVATKLGAGWWIGRADGLSRRAAFALGVTLIPRGEFSIVLAGVAAAAGFQQARPLIALLVLLLALAGTAATRHAPALAGRLFRRGADLPGERARGA
ncbi:MAG: cation:proton antiporter [Gemmatimonadetes bacterium]|nr:cation:proton antiporter [Gemmatimonadota bacterium]